MKDPVLLTGGRAFSTLDLARKFRNSGYPVYVADSVSYSVSRFSRSVSKYFALPSPTVDDEIYLTALSDIVGRYGIKLLIPTCEELFYIARKLPLFNLPCRVLVDEFQKLDQLHDKYRFIELASSYGFETPHTRKAETREELFQVVSGWEEDGPAVIKPSYSRFGVHLLVLGDPHATILPTRMGRPPWVVQQYVDGEAYSTYSVCHSGQLLAHVTYKTPYTYRVGHRGPGVYFISIQDQHIEGWVRTFVNLIQFTGQIAFDFVRPGDGTLLPIECNPRLTSGIHLFTNEAAICDALSAVPRRTVTAAPATRRMIAHALWWESLLRLRSWKDCCRFITDVLAAKDVVFSWRDPLPSLHCALVLPYLAWRSWKTATPLADIVTHDISWNGNPNPP